MTRRAKKNAIIESAVSSAPIGAETNGIMQEDLANDSQKPDNDCQHDDLVQQNYELQLKVQQYIEEKTNLLEQIDGLNRSQADYDKLLNENAKLKSKVQQLQEENDSYLMKISDLSFEIANLNDTLQKIPASQQSTERMPSRKNVRPGRMYPLVPNGGYSDWN